MIRVVSLNLECFINTHRPCIVQSQTSQKDEGVGKFNRKWRANSTKNSPFVILLNSFIVATKGRLCWCPSKEVVELNHQNVPTSSPFITFYYKLVSRSANNNTEPVTTIICTLSRQSSGFSPNYHTINCGHNI